MTSGIAVPARALARRVETRLLQEALLLRVRQEDAEVGSHGCSHSLLRFRAALHSPASRRRGGRSRTDPARNSAGQPGWALIDLFSGSLRKRAALFAKRFRAVGSSL